MRRKAVLSTFAALVTAGLLALPLTSAKADTPVTPLTSALTLHAVGGPLYTDVRLYGTLTVDDAAPAAGTVVTITRTGPGGTASLQATTWSNGNYAFGDDPKSVGTYTYTAAYAGVSGEVDPATATATASVTRARTQMALYAKSTVTYGDNVTANGGLEFSGSIFPGPSRCC